MKLEELHEGKLANALAAGAIAVAAAAGVSHVKMHHDKQVEIQRLEKVLEKERKIVADLRTKIEKLENLQDIQYSNSRWIRLVKLESELKRYEESVAYTNVQLITMK